MLLLLQSQCFPENNEFCHLSFTLVKWLKLYELHSKSSNEHTFHPIHTQGYVSRTHAAPLESQLWKPFQLLQEEITDSVGVCGDLWDHSRGQ